MSFYINDAELKSARFNDKAVYSIYYNNALVWEKASVRLFDWGSEDAEADEAWFQSLIDFMNTHTNEEIIAERWWGLTKKVTLTTPVLDETTHYIQCIGVNCDGEKTVTFQTRDIMDDGISYADYSFQEFNTWIGSPKRAACVDYYNAFPYKQFIKVVSKGTCAEVVKDGTGTPTYNDETVFLPSVSEVGFTLNPENPLASSYDEFCEENVNKTVYQYYTVQENRMKLDPSLAYGGYGNWDLRGLANSTWYDEPQYYRNTVNKDGSCGRGYGTGMIAPAFVIG